MANWATCGELTPGVLATAIPRSAAAPTSIEPRLVPRRTSVKFGSSAHRSLHASKNDLATACAETTTVVGRSGSAVVAKKSAVGAVDAGKKISLPVDTLAVTDWKVDAHGAIHTIASSERVASSKLARWRSAEEHRPRRPRWLVEAAAEHRPRSLIKPRPSKPRVGRRLADAA